MLTITKRLIDIPFAHRQPKHEGHCKWIHGHDWSFEMELSAEELDANGFIFDFGKFKLIKQWLEDNLDHACVLCANDPILGQIHDSPFFKLHIVKDASCEGLATYLFEVFNKMIQEETNGRAGLVRLTVFEDSKNSATVDKRMAW